MSRIDEIEITVSQWFKRDFVSALNPRLSKLVERLSQLKDGGAEAAPSDVDGLLFRLAAKDCEHLAAGMNDCTEDLPFTDWCVVCQSRGLLQKYSRATAPTETSARCGEWAFLNGIGPNRRDQLWKQARVNSKVDDDLYEQLIERERERVAGPLRTAEREFLDVSIEVWRELDKREPYTSVNALDSATELRKREKAAWERYRDELDKCVFPASTEVAGEQYKLDRNEVSELINYNLKKLSNADCNEVARKYRKRVERLRAMYED